MLRRRVHVHRPGTGDDPDPDHRHSRRAAPVDLLGEQDLAQGQQDLGYQKQGLAQIYYRKYPAASWEYVSGRGNDLVHTLVWMFQVGARDYQITMT